MGLAKEQNNQKVHKQDNLFLYFPMYICMGVYYILNMIASPFLWLYGLIHRRSLEGRNRGGDDIVAGAYLTEADKIAKEEAKKVSMVENQPVRQPIRVSQGLMRQREKLINSLEASSEARNDKPVTYRYTAVQSDGTIVTNTFVALSKIEVYTFLESEGYKVFKIETSPWIERLYGPSRFSSRKIRTKDIVFWLTQLSTYLKAGIPLTNAMRILSKQMGRNRNIKRTFDSVVYNLTLGESFSTCLEKQGEAFPPLLINMIKAAEATGDLEATLDEMADYYTKIETTRKEMLSALTYPLLVLVFSIFVIIFILVYLIPKFVDIYRTAGVTLNPITAFIIAASDAMRANLFYIVLVIFIFALVLYVMYKNIRSFRYFVQSTLMKMPVVGKLIIYKEMTIFTKTFSSLLRNNVFITDSMAILRRITSNEIYRDIMANTLNYIARGEKISASFKSHWAVPDVAYYMMVTGESTGELAEMMGKVSEYYAEQHRNLVNSLKSLVEPILIVFLAVIVGGIMIAIIVPMFSLYGELIR